MIILSLLIRKDKLDKTSYCLDSNFSSILFYIFLTYPITTFAAEGNSGDLYVRGSHSNRRQSTALNQTFLIEVICDIFNNFVEEFLDRNLHLNLVKRL